MKVVVLEESKIRKEEFSNLLQEKGHDVIGCSATGEFLEALNSSSPDRILMNVEALQHSKSIFTYFDSIKDFESIPIIYYNAPENYTGLADRLNTDQDKIIVKPVEVDDIVAEVD